jgi:hypothetical protein
MAATPITAYNGTRAFCEIKDEAWEGVRAFLGTGPDRKPLGTLPDRKTAMRAVSAANAAQRQQTEPAPWASGLPKLP